MSRTDARSVSLRRRSARVIPATITAALLLALGVALVWVVVLRLTAGTWPGAASATGGWVAGLTWGSVLVLAVSIGLGVLGLVLVIAGLKPGPAGAMVVQAGSDSTGSGAGQVEVVMPRPSIARLATARAAEVDGVDSVSASVGSRTVALTVRTPSQQRDDVQQRVQSQVQQAFQAAGLNPLPNVSVSVRTQAL